MKNHIRDYFDEAPVKAAFQAYKAAWLSLQDESKGYQMLNRHAWELGERLGELKMRHKLLSYQNDATSDPIAKEVIETAKRHTNLDIKTLENIGRSIRQGGGNILAELQEESKHALKVLDEGIFDENGHFRSQSIKMHYAKSSKDAWQRYAPMDALYESGESFAINESDRKDRVYQLAKVPTEIRRAKWKYMLAVADAAYSINIGRIDGESIDPNHLELLSGMLAMLSTRERGSDNSHIPDTHKYRHNPAIHSLHTLALADKMFHEVWREIDHDQGLSSKDRYFDKLRQMRARVFQAALSHDMGESDGELSQGILVAELSKEQRLISKATRDPLEHETFERHLDKQRVNLHHIHNGKATSEPIRDDEWNEMRKGYMQAYVLADRTDTFLGRFFKTLECMQSQQDYLRFQEVPGAKPLAESSDTNKEFSVNYVSKQFYDMDKWDSLSGPGRNCLSNLARTAREQNGNGHIEAMLQGKLAAVMERDVIALVKENIEQYYGSESQEMKRFNIISERRAPALGIAS